MPKIKDLGVKVIPETMRPPEQGGGACGCTFFTNPCGNCTFPAISVQLQCLDTVHACALPSNCVCTNQTNPCGRTDCVPTLLLGTSPFCQPGKLTGEQIATLRDQLQKQIAALDEYAKSVGPKTADEIDAREKAVNEELADLKARRKKLGK